MYHYISHKGAQANTMNLEELFDKLSDTDPMLATQAVKFIKNTEYRHNTWHFQDTFFSDETNMVLEPDEPNPLHVTIYLSRVFDEWFITLLDDNSPKIPNFLKET